MDLDQVVRFNENSDQIDFPRETVCLQHERTLRKYTGYTISKITIKVSTYEMLLFNLMVTESISDFTVS